MMEIPRPVRSLIAIILSWITFLVLCRMEELGAVFYLLCLAIPIGFTFVCIQCLNEDVRKMLRKKKTVKMKMKKPVEKKPDKEIYKKEKTAQQMMEEEEQKAEEKSQEKKKNEEKIDWESEKKAVEVWNSIVKRCKEAVDTLEEEQKKGLELEPASDTDFLDPQPLQKEMVEFYSDEELDEVGFSVPEEQSYELTKKLQKEDEKAKLGEEPSQIIFVAEYDFRVFFSVERKKENIELLLKLFQKFLPDKIVKKIKVSMGV